MSYSLIKQSRLNTLLSLIFFYQWTGFFFLIGGVACLSSITFFPVQEKVTAFFYSVLSSQYCLSFRVIFSCELPNDNFEICHVLYFFILSSELYLYRLAENFLKKQIIFLLNRVMTNHFWFCFHIQFRNLKDMHLVISKLLDIWIESSWK